MNGSFVYDPAQVSAWCRIVTDYISGGGDSFQNCLKKLNEQLEKLVQPNVWSGESAKANYDNFIQASNSFVSFLNSFNGVFSTTMTEFAKNVQNLEVSTLGVNSNIMGTFGTIDRVALDSMSQTNVNTDKVVYNFNVLNDIFDNLRSISQMLGASYDGLNKTLNQIGDNSEFWTGDTANQMRAELQKILTNSYNEWYALLEQCTNNIMEAKMAAYNVANGQGSGTSASPVNPGTYEHLDGKKNVAVTQGVADREREKMESSVNSEFLGQGPGWSSDNSNGDLFYEREPIANNVSQVVTQPEK